MRFSTSSLSGSWDPRGEGLLAHSPGGHPSAPSFLDGPAPPPRLRAAVPRRTLAPAPVPLLSRGVGDREPGPSGIEGSNASS